MLIRYKMFGLIKKTLCLLGLLTHRPVTTYSFPILDRISMLEPITDTSTFTTTFTSTPTTTPEAPYNYPIVVLHGLESSSEEMETLCDWLEIKFNANVYNMEIGNGKKTSLYSSLNDQLIELCFSIYEIDALQQGFHFIGISQGGLLARGYVERCNSYPVRNLITFVAPHGGVFWPNTKKSGLMYNDFFQNHLSIASYWRNPMMLDTYLTCSFLALLNNEFWRDIESPIQRRNIRNLSNFVMIWSPEDKVLDPPESGKFSFYDEDFNVIPLKETDLYKDDALGLKFLNFLDRLHIYETNCSHVDHRNPACFEQLYDILKRFL
jgi:palmitoyl-protein thioesterase